ncbi:MAG: DUF2057 domain-containing protein, partial [Alteromonadales bacterium]|nr:DUF2057 domain-containing protein [Alteromonadales bacterium]
ALLLLSVVLPIQANINVSLHQDLEFLVVKNKNVGFKIFDDSKVTLKNGQNQLVVRISKLLTNQGQREKFKSEPIVITFDLKDANVVIEPTRTFLLKDRVEGFDKNPTVYAYVDGKKIVIKQEILERGADISRDHADELKNYNEENNIASAVNKPAVKIAASPIKMSQDLFAKASDNEKEQFTDWAFKNRKSINTALNGEGKILPMLEYWYEKATSDEKAEILTWILAL